MTTEHENIAFNRPHFAYADGYFYLFDHTNNTLFAKLQDGEVAYSYPMIDTFGPIFDAHYDGFYFWTMENGASSTEDLIIRKWNIEDSFCILKERFDLIGAGNPAHRYDGDTFTIEHYNTVFSTTSSGNKSFIYAEDISKIEEADILALGPNSDGNYEEVTVTGTLGAHEVQLNFYTDYTYEQGDSITLTKSFYLFNNYSGRVDEGALYEFKASDMSYITHTEDNEYKNVGASTFAYIGAAKHLGAVHTMLYLKNNSLKFVNLEDLSYYTTMTIDNLQADGFTIIPVYALQVFSNTVYRLQTRAMYYGSDYVWSYYNYVMTPIRNYVDSVVADAFPNILPANGVNMSNVRAIVKDQYGLSIYDKPVFFTDDDDYGFMSRLVANTWIDGVASNYYKAGIQVREVTIDILVTQYD